MRRVEFGRSTGHESGAESGAESGVRIGRTDVGYGLFVTRRFTAGETILWFRGAVIDFAATLAKGERECDAFQIGPDRYLDLEPPGVFINHSCEPNTGVRDGVVLVALRDLEAGEEIRFDYSTTMDEDHWTLDCRCGSPRCRRTIRDFKWLPDEVKRDLLRRNVVPPFLVVPRFERGGAAGGAPRVEGWRVAPSAHDAGDGMPAVDSISTELSMADPDRPADDSSVLMQSRRDQPAKGGAGPSREPRAQETYPMNPKSSMGKGQPAKSASTGKSGATPARPGVKSRTSTKPGTKKH